GVVSSTGGGSESVTSVSIKGSVAAPLSPLSINFSNNGVVIPTTKMATPIKSALVVMAGPTFLRTYAPYALLRPAKTTSSHSFLNIFNFEPNMLCFFRVLIIDSFTGKKLNLCCSNITYHVLFRINDLHLV